MIRYRYREERSSLGEILRPVADVILGYNDFQVLLGRTDVFNRFLITFNEKDGWVEFKKHGD